MRKMRKGILLPAILALGAGVYTSVSDAANRSAQKDLGSDQIENIVVIYAENRSFDNLYGSFPGANGLRHVDGKIAGQLDRNGSVLKELPPIWDGLCDGPGCLDSFRGRIS
jgi:phospholipase C